MDGVLGPTAKPSPQTKQSKKKNNNDNDNKIEDAGLCLGNMEFGL